MVRGDFTLINRAPMEEDSGETYEEIGSTRGADLRLDWRRACLSVGAEEVGLTSEAHSLGSP